MRKLLLLTLLLGCGSEREIEAPAPPPAAPGQAPPPGGPPPARESFAQLKSEVIDVSCKRCHTDKPFITSESAWRGSQGPTRAANRSMPPAGSPEARALTDTNRQRLVNF